MKVKYSNQLTAVKLSEYLLEKGFEVSIDPGEKEVIFHAGTPDQDLIDEIISLEESELENKDEVKDGKRLRMLMRKHERFVVLQSILTNETLTQRQQNKIQAMIDAL